MKDKFKEMWSEGKNFLFDSKNENNNRLEPQQRRMETPAQQRRVETPTQTVVMENETLREETNRFHNAEQLMEQVQEKEGRFDIKIKRNENPNMDYCAPDYYDAIVEICNEIHRGKSAIVDFTEAEEKLRSKMIQYLIGFCHGKQIHIEMLKANWFAVDPNFSTEELNRNRK